MDPNALLERIRERLAAISRNEDVGFHHYWLGKEFKELDEWISKGGFLPVDWAR